VDNLPFPNVGRLRLSFGCFAIAQEHHAAIVFLTEHGYHASAVALLRCLFEAFVRGSWLFACASEDQVREFGNGEDPPRMQSLVEALETTSGFNNNVLSHFTKDRWRMLCGYTHTGGIHVQRWQSDEGIEPKYSMQEIEEVLRFSENLGYLSVVGMAEGVNDQILAAKVHARIFG